MSDTLIFVVGSGVFAITTTATLLYGYSWFNDKAVGEGIEDGSDAAEADGWPREMPDVTPVSAG